MGLLQYFKCCILSASALIRMTGICGGGSASVSCMKKIYTCTPVSFTANNGFWSRDTGLINRNLRNAGVESKCIMPLPWHEEDEDKEHIIRVSRKELESAAWWKSLQLDGLVLYSWALPKHTAVARAAHKAGIKIMLHLDRGLCLLPEWDSSQCWLKNAAKRLKMVVFNLLCVRHLKYVDYISASRPLIDKLKESWMYPASLNPRFREFACPVASHFCYNGAEKEERVVCVGRWSDEKVDEIKRPEFLRAVAEHFVDISEQVPFEIYGRYGETMRRWYEGLPEHKKARIKLMGAVPNAQLVETYCRSMVSVCPSRSESTHIASAEAMNCGASIVVGPQPQLGVLHWYISHGAGTIAAKNEPESFARAIADELACWRRGERDPQRIAKAFNDSFHVDKAVLRIFSEVV